MKDSLKPYLARSSGLHLAGAAFAVWAASRAIGPKATQIYTIDFVGPSAMVIQQPASGSEPSRSASGSTLPTGAPAKAQPQTEVDEFARGRRRPNQPLPKPSLLRGWREPKADEPPPAPAGPDRAAASGSEPSHGASGDALSPGDAGVSTDLPNFPYPWYISQVRAALWGSWSARMPRQGGQAMVVFTIMPNGSLVDVRTEETSGDGSFDQAAVASVQSAAPFPPLPRGFAEPFLKVHVTLKSN